MTYILAILGIAINFLSKYNARTKKEEFSFKYWIKDNWPELIQSLLFVIALLLMLDKAEFEAGSFYDWVKTFIPIPNGITVPVQLFAPFLTGLSINHIVYWYNKHYIKKKKSIEE